MADGDGDMAQLCDLLDGGGGGGALAMTAACCRASLRLPAGETLALAAVAQRSAGCVRVPPAERAAAECSAAARLLAPTRAPLWSGGSVPGPGATGACAHIAPRVSGGPSSEGLSGTDTG